MGVVPSRVRRGAPTALGSKPVSDEKISEAKKRFSGRLVALRRSYGASTGRPEIDMQTMAADLGIESERYRRYERGETEPPVWLLERICDLTKTTADCLIGSRAESDAPSWTRDPELVAAVAKRLRAARAAMAEHVRTDNEFAKLCSASVNDLGRWLDGLALPAVPAMSSLCERAGLDLDWIYRGNYDGLARDVAIRLRAILDGVTLPPADPEQAPAGRDLLPGPDRVAASSAKDAPRDQKVLSNGGRR